MYLPLTPPAHLTPHPLAGTSQAEIMKVHHEKHHQAYVTNLNIANEKFHEATVKNDLKTQIALQPAIKFNGGGHINHSIFWTNLAPQKQGGGELSHNSSLHNAINKEFGSLESFKTKFNTAAAGVQGSGWAWLGFNESTKRLEIVALPNQDPLTS